MRGYIVLLHAECPSRCIQSLISAWSHRAAEVEASFHTSPLMQVGTTESCDSSSIDVSWTESNNHINETYQHIEKKKFSLFNYFFSCF
jgi:hypothetical protein